MRRSIVFFKSKSGWCFPTFKRDNNQNSKALIQRYFDIWNSIKTEDDYYNVVSTLPIQKFIYYSKIKDRGYIFLDIGDQLQESDTNASV